MDLDLLAESARNKAKIHRKYFNGLSKKELTQLDERVFILHEKIFQQTDCTKCANCCRTLGPMITNRDIGQMAKALRLKTSVFIDQYLRRDEDGDWVFKSMPCPFLQGDHLCLIYDDRPKACREYPHTDRENIYQIRNLTIRNAETCPAVFEILEKLTSK